MKLASYRTPKGAGYGVVMNDGIVDLTRRIGRKFPDLRALLAGGALAQAEKIAKAAKKADLKLSKVPFLPVIPNPGKIVCVGLNYEEHRMETGRDKTENPALFIRVPESQVGHKQAILMPPESTNLDYEGEIAVIIGKSGRRISQENSWKHVAGYACYNDGSVRDWQRHTLQWTAGKNFSRTGGFGPWMVTRSEIADGEELTLETRLNGQVMQHATTEQMIHRIPRLINYISAFTTLEPGDVLVTGTPGGVGARRTPPVWMKPGDTVEIEVSKVGVLVNTIKAGELLCLTRGVRRFPVPLIWSAPYCNTRSIARFTMKAIVRKLSWVYRSMFYRFYRYSERADGKYSTYYFIAAINFSMFLIWNFGTLYLIYVIISGETILDFVPVWVVGVLGAGFLVLHALFFGYKGRYKKIVAEFSKENREEEHRRNVWAVWYGAISVFSFFG